MDDRFSALDGDLMTEALMMEEFNRLVQETPEIEEIELPEPTPIAPPVATKVGKHQSEALKEYQAYGKSLQPKNGLVFFDGFDDEEGIIPSKTTGGFFFSLDGFGVAVNPGRHFLQRFHETGHHISEINAVVVTRDDPEDLQDLYAIHKLNLQCNLHSSEFHLIRYFLHPSVFARSPLKPHFKQERNFLTSLDLFEERETIELCGHIKMTYTKDLALAFDLPGKRIGYGFTPCDVLIVNESNIPANLSCKVAFIVEHTGQSGDIRMELLRRLKASHKTPLFPVEVGLELDLKTMKIDGIDLKEVRVIQPEGPNGPLYYLSNESIL